jgi:hypothetical protein
MEIGKVKSIIYFQPKKRRVNMEIRGSIAKTFVVDGHTNSKNWAKVVVGDTVGNLEWFDEEMKIIDADSKVSVLK